MIFALVMIVEAHQRVKNITRGDQNADISPGDKITNEIRIATVLMRREKILSGTGDQEEPGIDLLF